MATVDNLSTVVSVIAALSVASERLVEIIKGLVPFLNNQTSDAQKERWRKICLQLLAMVAGIITAFLANTWIQSALPAEWTKNYAMILMLGLLASGGSGFWNSLLNYLLQLKNLKKAEIKRITGGQNPPPGGN